MLQRFVQLSLLLCFVCPNTAEAQFMTLNRNGVTNAVELSADMVLNDGGEHLFLRTDLFGQMMFGGFGAYLSLPVVKGFSDLRGDGAGLGNLEFGGLYTIDAGLVELSTRVGVVVPTIAGEDDALFMGSVGRFNNLTSVSPDALGGRVDLSARFSTGVVFCRADLGVDVYTRTVGDILGQLFLGLRANLAVGASMGLVQLTLESVNYGDKYIDGGMDFLHAFAAGLRLSLPLAEPYLGVIVPIIHGDIDNVVVTIGARAEL